MPREKQAVAELKICFCEAAGRVIRYTLMDSREMAKYGMSDAERISHKTRATGERNAFRKALKVLGVEEKDIQELLEGIKIRAKGGDT